jgi:hypothetical protein
LKSVYKEIYAGIFFVPEFNIGPFFHLCHQMRENRLEETLARGIVEITEMNEKGRVPDPEPIYKFS